MRGWIAAAAALAGCAERADCAVVTARGVDGEEIVDDQPCGTRSGAA